jgi:hypothetical protein
MKKNKKSDYPRPPKTFREWTETILAVLFLILFIVFFPQIVSFINGFLNFIGGKPC